MAQLRISATDEQKLHELETRQNFHAHSMGVAVITYLQHRNRLLAEQPVNKEKLGILEYERIRQELFWQNKVTQTELMQRQAGEAALKRVGININKGDYIIALGVVMELRSGEYVPVERKE